ncbi:uncharacterized protein LOC101890805 [Musca domestica]|uniref:Uncharacterized protein LOC101890805 n=1 Tax=Musca domestica TaxID=7370 RepID=A0A9J7CIW6_MUSDO|nr:uncharacterized protein LOC101890805 [Musca domestica]
MNFAQSFILSYVFFLHVNNICCEHGEDSWLEPDAWTLEQLNDVSSCKCQLDSSDASQIHPIPEKVSTDEVAFVYFKKLISVLFDRKHLMFDASLQRYERSMSFSLQLSQLEKLERLQDPRDLDNVLMEIFENTRHVPNSFNQCASPTSEAAGFVELIADILRDVWHLTQTSEIRFLLIVLIVVLCGWLLNKRFRIGLLALLGGGLFVFGYLHTYLECNRELEVNEMLEVLNRNKLSQGEEEKSHFFEYIKGFLPFSKSESIDNKDLLRKSTKISLGFCRPDHVLIMYFNDIFLKYLEVLLEQCTKTLTSLRENLSFPSYIVASIFLISIIGFVIKLTFQYILSPAVWSNILHSGSDKHRTHRYSNNAALVQGSANTGGDQISGENLKLLLNAINTAPLRQLPMNAVSGVQEVKECIEAPQSCEDVKPIIIQKKNPPTSQDNNNMQKEQAGKTFLNVTLEDMADE